MRALLFVFASCVFASHAFAAEGEVGTLGAGDPFEVGLVAGPWSQQNSVDPKAPASIGAATLLGVRVRAAGYTHETILGNGGGVEGVLSAGYAVPGVAGVTEGFGWAQLDALANVGLFNRGLGRFLVRLHALVGVGVSLFSGASLMGGGRFALAITEVFSLEANYLVLPSTFLTLSHRVTGALKVEPLQLALGADVNFGSSGVGEQHFSVVGTATWRPVFE